MRKIILFIASSMDGYIAGPIGEIDWLFTDGDYGYAEFYESIDATLSGYNTYSKIFAFTEFPYPGKKNYVFTSKRHAVAIDPSIKFIYTNPVEFIKKLVKQQGKNIWLVGGGKLNAALLDAGLIDEIVLSIHPVILGEGIKLFEGNKDIANYVTKSAAQYDSGLIQIVYEKPKTELFG